MLPQIQLPGLGAGRDGIGRRHGLRRNMQAGGKIVGAAVWNIAHRRAALQRHQPAQRFVQRTVAAGANHQIELAAQLRRGPLGVARPLGGEQLDQIARL